MPPSKQTPQMKSICQHFFVVIVIVMIAGMGCAFHSKNEPIQSTQSYISLDLEYSGYKTIYLRLNSHLKTILKTRKEAHITLVTPPEFKQLQKSLPASEIHEMASEFLSSAPQFTEICLGRSQKNQGSQVLQTYYIVVESEPLIRFRKSLAEKAKLPPNEFNPNLFYPHITLGFTKRDIHYEDGAIKDKNSCLDSLQFILKKWESI